MRLTRRMGPDYRACARGRLLRLFVWSSCLVAVLTLRPFAAAQDARPGFGEDHPRIKTSAPIFFDKVDTVRFTPSGSVSDLGVRTASAGSCVLESTYTDADFNPPGNFSIVLGVAETEIFAASYTIAPEFFPIEIQSVEMVFAQTGVEDTVTQLELLILKGTPDQNQIVGAPIPYTLDFTTTLADAINVFIDLSANPVLVENNGTDTFSVGFRIVEHNNQTENPCNFNPPSNSNAFPTVDVSGVQNEADNWLFLLNCGPLGCPAFWNSFEFLGLCQPAGDWVLRATWAPQTCDFLRGACCLGDGNCTVNEFDFICTGQGGRFLGENAICPAFCDGACCFSDGACSVLTSDACEELNGSYLADGTDCDPDPCPDPEGACCVESDPIACFEFTDDFCTFAGGTWHGAGTECIDADQNGIDDICETFVGACCLPSGSCDNDVTEDDCLGQGGGYAGDDSLCANVTCVGACCLDTICAGDTEAAGCPFEWYGPQTSCSDEINPCLVDPEDGACCLANGSPCQVSSEANCSTGEDTWFGPGSICDLDFDQCAKPPDPVGACCVVDGEPCECQEGLTLLECENLPGEWGGSNSLCEDCEPCEACCDPCIQTCTNELPSVCVTAGDEPQGPETTCANTACAAPAGACCFSEPDGCEDRTEFHCNLLGGIWQGCEEFCADANCTVTGACCLPNETCEELQLDACEINQGGDYQGDFSTCVPGLCEEIECTFDSECDDGNGCNGVETCVANVCQNGPPPADGTLCNDGNACTQNDQCTAGNCGGTAVDCSASDDQCNTASCNPAGPDGNCDTLTPKPNGTLCNDNNVCTENDQCTAGSCGGTGVNCSGAGDQCNSASCDSGGAEGNCDILTPVKDGTACNDGAACTENDQCTAGNCGGTAVDCTGDGDQCNIASCDPTGIDGNCDILTQEPDGTACSDGEACTENDQCTAGSCGGTTVDCSGAGGQCNTASCDATGAEGNCDTLTPLADGTLCNDSDVCTENDQCTAGSCGGTGVDCSGADDQCNTASCNAAGADGNCDVLTPRPDGTPCDDQDACTESDNCTSGVCGGTAVDCTGFGDQCNIASCDPAGADGNCDILTPEPDGTLCDDQDACTESDICTAGVCSGAAVDCTGAGDQCNTASCNPAGAEGNCDILTQQPDGTLCDDQDDCTENDQCTAGLCGGAPIMPCCGNDITEDGEQCDPPDGTTCDENCQFLPTGACCKITGNCQEAISENACNAAGGTYQGDGTFCTPDLCPLCISPPGAAENDCCADAIPIFTGLTNFNTTFANTDGPIHLGCQFDGQTYNDIWYQYMADCTVDTIVSTCEDLGAGADYDTDLVVYDGCDCDNLVLLGCNDDDPDNPCGGAVLYHSTVTVSMIAGQCYLVRAGGWFDPDFGTGTLLIEPQCGACCQGDACLDSQGSQECADAGGVFQGAGSACVGSFGEIDCTITGACCTTGGGCAQTTSQGCAEQSGDYQSDGTICDPDPCVCGDCPWDVGPPGPNGQVGPEDLAYILGNWGPIPPDADPELLCIDNEPPDAGNGVIGAEDLAKILGNWGPCQ